MARFVFQRNATSEQEIVYAPTFNLAVEKYVEIRRNQINSANSSKQVNRIWVEKNAEGGYTCVSIDGKDDGYRFAIKATYYAPTATVTTEARIDSRMDGGRIGSMGMIGL